MFVKFGKNQAWFERATESYWKPVVEIDRNRKEVQVWFLGMYAVFDRA